MGWDGNNNARGAKRRVGAAEGGARVAVPIPSRPGPPGGVWGRKPPRKANSPKSYVTNLCSGLHMRAGQ